MFRASLFLVLAFLISGISIGQSPTPEQVEMLRNLSPEQRAAIEQQLGAPAAVTGDVKSQKSTPNELGPLLAEHSQDSLMLDEEWRLALAESRRRLLLGGDTIVIELKSQTLIDPQYAPERSLDNASQAEMSKRQLENLAALRDLILSKNPYRLTRDGFLQLPGFAPVALSGLTEGQATLRLSVLADFRNLDVKVTRLPVRPTGVEALKPFGYELFERPASTFRPVTDVPVPADYVVGPGDEIEVQLYGNQNRTLQLIVGRDGRISFPELGPISVGGQTFSSVKSGIEGRVARQMIGVRASVSMGDARGIRVFVLGEARRPGSYTISGLGTITSALFAAGGVRPIGSLRNVELKRSGKLVRTFDLYDMLIRGDVTDDAKLLPGDVVFIPPVGPVVSVDGEVRRPAIYETRGETTIKQIIDLAGGPTPDADVQRISLTRIDSNGLRTVIDATLDDEQSQSIHNGDLLHVSRLRPTLDSGIVLKGHVHAPASFAYRAGMRLTDVIHSVDDLKPNADLHYVLIRRELPPDRHIAVLSADLGAALAVTDSSANIPLMPRDQITVFDLVTGRDHIIRPLVDELRLQSNYANPTSLVRIDGHAKLPGVYPLEPGMTVRDIVRAGGGLSDAAFGGLAELTRYKVVDGEQRRTELISIDLGSALRGDPSANLILQPFDTLSIKEVPGWGEQEFVELLGEVRFPGRYAIARGETLRSVLSRAGGLSDLAFPQGSVFTREELRTREQQQINILTDRLQKDLSVLAIQSAAANQAQAGVALQVGQTLMTQLRSSRAVGRLVINLPGIINSQASSNDILLRNGDLLMIPRQRQEVTVIGEVQSPTSHLFRSDLRRDDYIALSGGATRKADKSKVYVVRADGTVIGSAGNGWFSRNAQVSMHPGDTVVVPLDTERLPALPFWQAVTQIVYNLAISAAAVNSF